MAYPFLKLPTLGEFLDIAISKHGAKENKTAKVQGLHGQTEIRYLIRECSNGKKALAVIPDIKNEERLTPSVLRSLCNCLEISLKEFGFDLG